MGDAAERALSLALWTDLRSALALDTAARRINQWPPDHFRAQTGVAKTLNARH